MQAVLYALLWGHSGVPGFRMKFAVLPASLHCPQLFYKVCGCCGGSEVAARRRAERQAKKVGGDGCDLFARALQ
jgi:hypothetical protein